MKNTIILIVLLFVCSISTRDVYRKILETLEADEKLVDDQLRKFEKENDDLTSIDKSNDCESLEVCPELFQPVCGSDGMTYENKCQMKMYNCETNSKVTIAEEGPCDKANDCESLEVCPDLFQPVCGTDGMTYENKCQMKMYNCETKSKVTVAEEGPCDKSNKCEALAGCTKKLDPLCGTDGKTYDNYCLLKMYNCETESNVEVDYEGRCQEANDCESLDVCPDLFQPVCGTDGMTYENKCQMKMYNCETNSKVTVAEEGPCNTSNGCETLAACTKIYDPVCGTDGNTYENDCSLKTFNCKTESNVEVDYDGPCKKAPGKGSINEMGQSLRKIATELKSFMKMFKEFAKNGVRKGGKRRGKKERKSD